MKINYALDDWQTYHSIKGAFPCNTQNNVVYWNHLLAPIQALQMVIKRWWNPKEKYNDLTTKNLKLYKFNCWWKKNLWKITSAVTGVYYIRKYT